MTSSRFKIEKYGDLYSYKFPFFFSFLPFNSSKTKKRKSFIYSGAKPWTSLPLDAKLAESVYIFKNLISRNDSGHT